MLRKLRVRDFKSLADVTVVFPRMSVLFGPNSAGKSNLLDAIQALSRIGTERTLMDALDGRMIRGYAFELFALPQGGISGLASKSEAQFSIEADLTIPEGKNGRETHYRYGVDVEIGYRSGALANRGEYLSALSNTGKPKGTPAIEVTDGQLSVRRQSGGGRPRLEQMGLTTRSSQMPALQLRPTSTSNGRARSCRAGEATIWILASPCEQKRRPWMSPTSGCSGSTSYRSSTSSRENVRDTSKRFAGRLEPSFRAYRRLTWILVPGACSTSSSDRTVSRSRPELFPKELCVSSRCAPSASTLGAALCSLLKSPRTVCTRAELSSLPRC